MNIKIGQGIDIHPFTKGRKLILGGVEIPYEFGLEGHSDADVLLHALSDAILGALGLQDIGHFFPNTDQRWKGASSLLILKQVSDIMNKEGFKLINADMTVLAEAPKIAPYISNMKHEIANVLSVTSQQLSIKATTTEKLGFVGRKEGILASAIVLLTA